MIRKPPDAWRREGAVVTHLRSAATGSVATVRVAQYYVHGMLCWSVAALWGFAALAGGLLMHSVATFVGMGAMAAFMAWSGGRMFRQAAPRRSARPSIPPRSRRPSWSPRSR